MEVIMTQNTNDVGSAEAGVPARPYPLDNEINGGIPIYEPLHSGQVDQIVSHLQGSFDRLRAMSLHPASAGKELGSTIAYSLFELNTDEISALDEQLVAKSNERQLYVAGSDKVAAPNVQEIWHGFDKEASVKWKLFRSAGYLALSDGSFIAPSSIWALKLRPAAKERTNKWGWI